MCVCVCVCLRSFIQEVNKLMMLTLRPNVRVSSGCEDSDGRSMHSSGPSCSEMAPLSSF